jgi:hypothetical protein
MDMLQLQGLNLQETKEAILTLAHLADVKMVRYSEPSGPIERQLWYHYRGLRDGLLDLVTSRVGPLEEAQMNLHQELQEGK